MCPCSCIIDTHLTTSLASFTLIWQTLHQDQKHHLHLLDKIFTKIKNIIYTHLTTSLTPSPTFTTTSHHHKRLNLHTPPQLRKHITSSHCTYLSEHQEGPAPRQQGVWIRSWLGHRYLVCFILFTTKLHSYLAVMARDYQGFWNPQGSWVE